MVRISEAGHSAPNPSFTAPFLQHPLVRHHRNGPKTSSAGSASKHIDAIGQPDPESPFILARRPRMPITIPATSEMNTIASARRPRGAQPINDTGVKYKPTTARGAIDGMTICLVNALMG